MSREQNALSPGKLLRPKNQIESETRTGFCFSIYALSARIAESHTGFLFRAVHLPDKLLLA
jgi:hypothetical protein